MSVKLSKEAYIKLIEEDLAYLNKRCQDGDIELDHIKVIICASIDWYYPEHKQQDHERD